MSKETKGSSGGSGEEGEEVPILTAEDPLQTTRLNTLANHFRSCFHQDPSFFVRVPGRVNLIGEHIDYCGYAVFPMAIQQDILLAVSPSKKPQLRLTNYDAKYKEFERDFAHMGVEVCDGGPTWHNYFICGLKGALEIIPEDRKPTGMMVAVWGNIPASSGLSSSSALVSAAALAIMHLNQCRLSKEVMATLSAKSERFIGTEGGGMDQAIAFLGKAGCAKMIEFDPLRAADVILPESAVFVIAHSMARHNKASTGDYNLRVAECRMAAQIIAKKNGQKWEEVRKLKDIQTKLDKTLEEMAAAVIKELHDDPYTLEEICNILETTYEHLKEASLTASFGASQTFKLRQRALHVFQEAGRVLAFRETNEDESIEEEEKLRRLGSLMSESHASLRELYECSHPDLDELVGNAIDCGAFGARLTGAGWGGCAVALSTKDKVHHFMDALKEKFYVHRGLDVTELDDLVFQTAPNQGAVIYLP